MSSESLKFIVENLNSPPFNCNTSLIAFDTWPPTQLLQQLSDVISWITQTANIDVTKESADETALRLLYNLKILKFKPPTDIEQLEEWRAGIVEGTKKSIYPVLLYLFSHVDLLKQRAYLAKYLVQDEIPNNIIDNDVAQIRNELAHYMEEFKEMHTSVLDVQQDTMMIEDIKADLKSMEQEKEGLLRKIEKAYKRIQNLPALERRISAANELSSNRERLDVLEMQRLEQRDGVVHTEKTVQRLKDQLSDLRAASENIDPSNLITQLEHEIATNSYMLDEKLSKEIEQKQRIVSELANASSQPEVSSEEVAALQREVDAKTSAIMALEQDRDKREEDLDENFSVFRHQASNVERRKQGLVQKLQDARKELSELEQHVEQKKQVLRSTSGSDVMSGQQFKSYVVRVRDKKVVYKKKKAQIEDLLTEREVLLRTIDLLVKKHEVLKDMAKNFEGRTMGYGGTHATRQQSADLESMDDSELKDLVKKLMESLDQRSEEIAPLKKLHEQQQQALNEEKARSRSKQDDRTRRQAEVEDKYEEQKNEIEKLRQDELASTELIRTLEEQVAEAERQVNMLEQEDTDEQQARLKEQVEETRRTIEGTNERIGKVADLNIARNRMLMWRGLLTMFQAKLASTE